MSLSYLTASPSKSHLATDKPAPKLSGSAQTSYHAFPSKSWLFTEKHTQKLSGSQQISHVFPATLSAQKSGSKQTSHMKTPSALLLGDETAQISSEAPLTSGYSASTDKTHASESQQ